MYDMFVHPPVTPLQWIMMAVAFAITLPQGILLFRSAQKRGRFPWLWGLWGLTTFPMPTILYYIFVIIPDRKNGKNKKPT
jgi:hypothetical protein